MKNLLGKSARSKSREKAIELAKKMRKKGYKVNQVRELQKDGSMIYIVRWRE